MSVRRVSAKDARALLDEGLPTSVSAAPGRDYASLEAKNR
jgi:hypothetical protein